MNAAAAQAHHNTCAKTRLGMSLHHLEIGLAAARRAGMEEQARRIQRWITDQQCSYDQWPLPVREQGRAAS